MGTPLETVRRFVNVIAAPAAGSETVIVNDGHGDWIITSLVLTLTTDATVANRIVRLIGNNQSVDYFASRSQSAQTASTGFSYYWFSGSNSGVVNGGLVPMDWPTDGFVLPRGHRLTTSTVALQAADAWGVTRFEVLEYPSAPHATFLPLVPYLVEPREFR